MVMRTFGSGAMKTHPSAVLFPPFLTLKKFRKGNNNNRASSTRHRTCAMFGHLLSYAIETYNLDPHWRR
jgi:hypothetical protein